MEENTRDFPCFVADCSFLTGYLLGEKEAEGSEEYIDYILENNGQIYVPQLFWFEIENVLLIKSRPRKTSGVSDISKTDISDIQYYLKQLPIYTDLQPDEEIQNRIFTYAEEHNLTFYDAAYLELARRYNLPLKTYDEDLKKAYAEARL